MPMRTRWTSVFRRRVSTPRRPVDRTTVIEPIESVTSAVCGGIPFARSVTSAPRRTIRWTELSMSLTRSSVSGMAPWIRRSPVNAVRSTGIVARWCSRPVTAPTTRWSYGRSALLRGTDLVDRQPQRGDDRDDDQRHERGDEARAPHQGIERAREREQRDDPAHVFTDAQQLRPGQGAGEQALPDQRVGEPDDQAATGEHAQGEEDRRVDEGADQDPDRERERDLELVRTHAAD